MSDTPPPAPTDGRDDPTTTWARTSRSLAGLLDLDPAGPIWLREDLAGLVRHQLDAPIAPAFGPLHESADKLLASAPDVRTFGDLLLRAPHPPVGLLRLAKRFAKARRHGIALAGGGLDGGVPPEVDKLLYAAAVVAARLRLGERISELPDEVFADNARWAAEQDWAGDDLRALMRQWLAEHGG